MADWQIDLLIERGLEWGGGLLLMFSAISYMMHLRCKFGLNHPKYELLVSKNPTHLANIKEMYEKSARFTLKWAKYSFVAGVTWLIIQWGYSLFT